jgi:hypothetical protein
VKYGRGAVKGYGLREGVVHREALGSGDRSGGISKKTPSGGSQEPECLPISFCTRFKRTHGKAQEKRLNPRKTFIQLRERLARPSD